MADKSLEVLNSPNPFPFVEEIDFKEIEKLGIVGKGSFGTVFKALWRGIFVAVKDIEQESERNAFTIEVRQLSRVSHPNIVKLYGACTLKPHVCLVMEYAEGGSLYNVLHCSPRIQYTSGHAMSWALQCAEGVAYLHSMEPKPLIHRDLKPPNLLLIKGGTVLKICDFGTVTDKATLMTNNKGSAAWMAPEVFEGSRYTEKCDVFSWGIILWEVLSRQQPFKDIEYTYRIMWSVHMGRRPPLIEGCPKPIENLMTTCWHPSPSERPSMKNVVNIMQSLCKFFPGGENALEYDIGSDSESYYDEESTMDTDKFDSWRQSYKTSDTSSSQVSNTLEVINCQLIKDANLSQSIASNKNDINKTKAKEAKSNEVNDPENFEPKIVTSKFNNHVLTNKQNNKTYDICNANTKDFRNGILTSNFPMKPLTLEVDQNAWELKPDDDEFQRLIGNVSNSQGREHLSVTETKATGQQQLQDKQQTNHTIDNSESTLDIESMKEILDSNLRPPSPDPNSRLSQQIFDEHIQLTQEYLKIQTEIAYLTRHREDLVEKMTPSEREERLEYRRRLEEKEGLLKLQANLKRQLELIRKGPKPQLQTTQRPHPNENGWVTLISPNQQ